ncbi:MAG: hypothetical protein OI74_15635 [Gammaproteobacteria bacterium (ex Lamellibrachia satsuma)]|nr:MAG: hypothetical protein HPY30_14370 [Gammaproteobacteria bacterium (ex Lamellibrachia satsuma)]RRS31031.1 MAG: hypothetical protein OI74_15635 [Gammaproteobacteria bacterium (ex Lamellibrachia satsuma)]RRS34729.1 MAG: hypothetical protein NV67_12320 [Gammaproteobacteria bacterium (ex Lamellibrachia satsuma)]
MAKQLRQIISPLSAYITTRFQRALRWPGAKDNKLPAHLQIAFMRGESLLRERFFSYLEGRHMDDAETQLFFWRQLRENPELLTAVSQQSGLHDALKRQADAGWLSHTEIEMQHYTAYCCLLWDLKVQKEQQLLVIATDRLFAHFSSSLFPSERKQSDPEQLKREIRKRLAQQWNIRPEIKESFHTTDDAVTFTLLARLPAHHPVELIVLQGKRLKPTRLKACQDLLRDLEAGLFKSDMPEMRTPKKSSATDPF